MKLRSSFLILFSSALASTCQAAACLFDSTADCGDALPPGGLAEKNPDKENESMAVVATTANAAGDEEEENNAAGGFRGLKAAKKRRRKYRRRHPNCDTCSQDLRACEVCVDLSGEEGGFKYELVDGVCFNYIPSDDLTPLTYGFRR
jgi:hypothetical protein